MRKKGFYKETTYQLILIFITLVFLGMLVGSIFSGINLQNAICKAIPWLCGERQDVDYEISLKSTQNLICAVGSVWEEKKWDGGLDCNWGEPETGEPFSGEGGAGGGGSSGTADITAFAASDEEEELDISDARKLQSSFNCGTDETGKYTCTVKNFVMPQELAEKEIAGVTLKPEEWIAYWGDPNYLVYWSSFPSDEDTWNFKVNWVHHVVIGVIAAIPMGKATGLGLKTFWTALKGAGKKAIRTKVSQHIFKKTSSGTLLKVFNELASKPDIIKKISPEILESAIRAVGTDVPEEIAEMYGREILSKLSKKQLKGIMTDLGIKYGRKEALKEVMLEGTKDMLKKRIESLKRPLSAGLIMGGKVVGLEAALRALAESTMNKYKPIGNAIAIKNPGNESEDLEILELPAQMKGKPVLMSWKPTGGKEELKHAHLVSPCYLKEFDVNKELVSCGGYEYNKTSKATTCTNGMILDEDKDMLKCGEFITNKYFIDEQTGMFDDFNKQLNMDDKKLYEVDNDWDLKKIYLPWFLDDGDNSPKYYIEDIEFLETPYGRNCDLTGTRFKVNLCGEYGILNELDLQIGEKMDEGRLEGLSIYREVYDAKISCGRNCKFMKLALDSENVIMSSGEDYTLHIYYTEGFAYGKGGVAVDVYDHDECTKTDKLTQESYRVPFACNDIKSGFTPPYAGLMTVPSTTLSEQVNGLRNAIDNVKKNEGKDNADGTRAEYYVKITPADDIKAKDLDYLNSNYLDTVEECKENIDDKICFRTLSDKVEIKMSCNKNQANKKSKIAGDIYNEVCEIAHKQFTGSLYGGSSHILLSRYFNYDSETKEITDVTYSDLSFRTDGTTIVTFFDSDEDGEWDDISLAKLKGVLDQILPDCIFGKDWTVFKIKFVDVKDGKPEEYMYMENCKTESVVISFEGDQPSKNMIDVEGPNYCTREDKGISRTLKTDVICGISPVDIGSVALVLGGLLLGDGMGAMIAIGVITGTSEAYGEIDEDVSMIWPGKR